jgi:hypothetical protein
MEPRATTTLSWISVPKLPDKDDARAFLSRYAFILKLQPFLTNQRDQHHHPRSHHSRRAVTAQKYRFSSSLSQQKAFPRHLLPLYIAQEKDQPRQAILRYNRVLILIMPPPIQSPLSIYEARKATFLQKEVVAGPSRKKVASGSKVGWPHPVTCKDDNADKKRDGDNGSDRDNKDESAYPSPRSMASLGLYYDPASDINDQCTVYPDGHSISRWKAGDTAYDRLRELDSTISWVMIEKSKRACDEREGGKKYTWTQEEDDVMPTGKQMIDARLRTFAGAWPLDGKKGWKPTSKKVRALNRAGQTRRRQT